MLMLLTDIFLKSAIVFDGLFVQTGYCDCKKLLPMIPHFDNRQTMHFLCQFIVLMITNDIKSAFLIVLYDNIAYSFLLSSFFVFINQVRFILITECFLFHFNISISPCVHFVIVSVYFIYLLWCACSITKIVCDFIIVYNFFFI